MKSLRERILDIIEDRENMLFHSRRSYWTDQIIQMVRHDERDRIKQALHKSVRANPNQFHFDDAAAFLSMVEDL